ncbi:MAG TPA: DUF6089 family protein [Chryseosolibacter sp.]|nr:DUF6089 family protein [Chryseosolibacter sp.]
MRISLVPVVIVFASLGTCFAQRSEVGFGIGTFNYTGDLSRNYNILNSKPAGTLLYRSNLSRVVSFRGAATAGKLGAFDKRQKNDPFANNRSASFNIFLLEFSGVMEYHFLNWREDRRILRFTPYMFAGLGVFGMSGSRSKPEAYSDIQGTIPFGIGAKYVINPYWYVALEFGARKTFFDYLDNISYGDQRFKNYQYGNPEDNDAYYFFGITLTRTFYVIPCPTNPYK